MIRIVGPGDWAEWRDLRLAALRDAPGAFSASLADWADAPEQRWRDRLDGTFNAVADLGGHAVGMVTGFPRDDAVELGTLWVAPHARGRGVGEALVRTVLGWAATRRVTLQVDDGNTAARALYRRIGFAGDRRLEYQTKSPPRD
jgi:ribosomal protein S18 acetylase RimI-like enzyme